jgi:hypothetical protein
MARRCCPAKDDRTDIFGIPYEPPERDEAVAQYQRGSMHKLQIADWHGAEFERLEDELTTADFFDFDTERFLPAQAHADGALILLAAGFDAIACAVAHRYGVANPRSRVPVGVELGLPARRRGRAGSASNPSIRCRRYQRRPTVRRLDDPNRRLLAGAPHVREVRLLPRLAAALVRAGGPRAAPAVILRNGA